MNGILNKIKRVIKSFYQLGFYCTLRIVWCRINADRFKQRMRVRVQVGHVYSTWCMLSKKYRKEWQSYKKVFFQQEITYQEQLFSGVPKDVLLEQADVYARHEFQVLGSQPYQLDDAMWHTDIRLKLQGGDDYLFSPITFYSDIAIEVGEDTSLVKDIKVPWELSRLQHLPILGYAYDVTGNGKYQDVFVYHVQHWRRNNHYLQGVNWACPMEVALRSISLIIAGHTFKKSSISDDFWQSYVALLYDHMIYLENNWEWYDGRTSNHYLSNIVGYLYLCWFFRPLCNISKKTAWVVREIIAEMNKQVFDEGTSYEGSTKYHILVTELFYHAQQLCAQMDLVLPPSFHEKLERMMEFVHWCKVNTRDYITIGDDDSGKITFAGLPLHDALMHKSVKHYNQFGVSFFKDLPWHVSLRHHAYNARQPSGHYHNDAGSMTVAFNGIPVIVDPGSYVYTPSRRWRNYFRSAQMHSVSHLAWHEPVSFDCRLFALALPENRIRSVQNDKQVLQTSHRLYDAYKLMYDRKIICTKDAVEIIDNWSTLDSINEDIIVCSNFIFDHMIVLYKAGDDWLIYYDNKLLLVLHSSHEFVLYNEHKAVSYGQLIPIQRLSTFFNIKEGSKSHVVLTR